MSWCATESLSDADIAGRGDWLVERRAQLEQGESAWLGALATFDREQGYRLDGHLSCVTWLVFRTGMSRGRIAHELGHRPQVAEAFASTRISYSAVRAITRLDRADPAVDAALVNLATVGTVRDLERVVRHYQLCAEQDQAPDAARLARRGIRLHRAYDGLGSAEVTLDAVEIEEFDAALNAFMNANPVDESSREDALADHPDSPWERVAPWKRKADALMELVRTAMAHLGKRFAAGADRYMVHIVRDSDGRGAEYLAGTPVRPGDAARVSCDATTVTHHYDGDVLALGRRTRVWSSAQRRAISVRDGGFCRFPGCDRTVCDVHHLQPWAAGGLTDVENGLLLCTRHHTLIHDGFSAGGDANRGVSFQRPDGSLIATTTPITRLNRRDKCSPGT